MRAIWLAVGIAGAGLVTACKDSPVKPIEEENLAPVANFEAPCLALRCEFRDTSRDDDGTIVKWTWSFGDEGSSQRNPIYNYPAAGSFQVSLTVTDNEGKAASITKNATPTPPAVTTLTCSNPGASGGFVACTLTLQERAGLQAVLTSSSCDAHGNVFKIIVPQEAVLTSDGCYEDQNKSMTLPGPFEAGTEINAAVIAPLLKNHPSLRVSGEYPVWHLTFEDGGDDDFNDLEITLTALPAGN
jgi:hypothetical protein